MKALLAFALAATFSAAALSATITRTLDFQDHPPGLNGRSNFNYGGLRFSPPCHIHAGHHGPEGQEQIWLQSDHDNNNCDSIAPDPEGGDPYERPNPGFIGFGFEDFYVDRFGAPFTLLGLAGVGYHGTNFTVISSKGGTFSARVLEACCDQDIPYVLPWEWFALTGPQWTDITWFTLSNIEAFGWQPHQGWDDIRYSYRVAEPGTALLVGGGLAFLAITRRRRRSL